MSTKSLSSFSPISEKEKTSISVPENLKNLEKYQHFLLLLGIFLSFFAFFNQKIALLIGCSLPFLLCYLLKFQNSENSEESQRGVVDSDEFSDGISENSNKYDRKNEKKHLKVQKWRSVSERMRKIGESSSAFSGIGWVEYSSNPYDCTENPLGCINLAMAENTLSLDILQDWFDSHPNVSLPPPLKEVAGYKEYRGLPVFRQVFTDFVNLVLTNGKSLFSTENLTLTSGASSAVELVVFCISDPNDAIIVPSPFYPGFVRDVEWRTPAQIIPAYTESSSNFDISENCLENAWKAAVEKKLCPRAILFSSPCNPTGFTYSTATIVTILRFARSKNLHVICDEIYGGSVYDDGPSFTSIAEVMLTEAVEDDVERVHIIYGLAKDVSLPGFRVGALYTQNKDILEGAKKLSRFTSVSTHTQLFLTNLLSDEKFLEGFLHENRRRLKSARDKIVDVVNRVGLNIAKGNSGQYVFIDFSSKLSSYNEEGEMALFKKLACEVGLNLNPGRDSYNIEPGWFRLCFGIVDSPTLDVAFKKNRKFLYEQLEVF